MQIKGRKNLLSLSLTTTTTRLPAHQTSIKLKDSDVIRLSLTKAQCSELSHTQRHVSPESRLYSVYTRLFVLSCASERGLRQWLVVSTYSCCGWSANTSFMSGVVASTTVSAKRVSFQKLSLTNVHGNQVLKSLCVAQGTEAARSGRAFAPHKGSVPLSATVLGAPAEANLSLTAQGREAAKKLVRKHSCQLQTESVATQVHERDVAQYCKNQSASQVVPFLDHSQQMQHLGQWYPMPAPCDMAALTCNVEQECSKSNASIQKLDARWRSRHLGKRKVQVTRMKGIRPSTCLAEGCCHCKFSGRNKQSVASTRTAVKRAIQQVCPGKLGQEQLQGGDIVLVWTAMDGGRTHHVVVYVANYNMSPWRPTFLHLDVSTESVSDFNECFLPQSSRDRPERADDLYFTFEVARRGAEPAFEGFMSFLLSLHSTHWFIHALHLSGRTTPFLNARTRGMVKACLPRGGEQAEVLVMVTAVPIPPSLDPDDKDSEDGREEDNEFGKHDLEEYEAEEYEAAAVDAQRHEGPEPATGIDLEDSRKLKSHKSNIQ
eukprot:6492192-Amphidinium_carterae.2